MCAAVTTKTKLPVLSRFSGEGTRSDSHAARDVVTAKRRANSSPSGIILLRRSWLGCVFLAGVAGLGFATSVRAQEPDAATIAKAKEFIAAAHSIKLADQMLTLMEKPLTQLIEKVNPGRGKEIADLLREKLLPAMRERLPEFTDLASHIYAKHFTAADLDQLIAFYESPIGKKLLAEQPAMLTEMNSVAQAWGQNLAMDVMRKLAPEFQKRGLTMPNI